MSRFKQYWKIHGTRRPFPSLYKAVEMYGRENVYFDKPFYEKDNQCPFLLMTDNLKRIIFHLLQNAAEMNNKT